MAEHKAHKGDIWFSEKIGKEVSQLNPISGEIMLVEST
jgi:streptogramin lyase